jgi:hypothetical protein
LSGKQKRTEDGSAPDLELLKDIAGFEAQNRDHLAGITESSHASRALSFETEKGVDRRLAHKVDACPRVWREGFEDRIRVDKHGWRRGGGNLIAKINITVDRPNFTFLLGRLSTLANLCRWRSHQAR